MKAAVFLFSAFTRRFLVLALLLVTSIGSVAISNAAESIVTKAPRAFLYEPTSGSILFAKAPDEPFAPGSLTKVMTAATIFHLVKEGELKLDQICTVSEHAWRTGGAPSRRSTMFAAIKSEIAVEDLLKGLLVTNGNDAAIVLAECVDGSEAAFATRMTEFAQSIGMNNSRFVNPTGFDTDPSTTTVRDQVRLGEYILNTHPDLYPMFAIPDFTWSKIFQRNKNPLLGEIRNLDGFGGGNDPNDGFSGLATVDRDGRRIIAAVAGLQSDKHRLQTLKEVIEGAWEYFAVQTLYSAGDTVAEATVYGGETSSVTLVAQNDVNVLLGRGDTLEYRIRAVYDWPIAAPVQKGQQVGEVRVIGKHGIVYRAPLVTGEPVAQGNLLQRALDGLQELVFGWI